MFRNQEKNIKDVLKDFFKEEKIYERKFHENTLRKAWKEVMGPMIDGYSSKVFFKEGTIYIKLTSSALRQELQQGKSLIIKNLNTYLKEDIVKDVVLN